MTAVSAPVLALAGAADGIVGTVTARLVGDCYPDVTVEILPACGHFPWLDDPTRFRTQVASFLSR